MKEFLIRSASGLVYAGLMVGAITISPWIFLVVFLFILINGLIEFYRLSASSHSVPMVIPGIITGVILFIIVFLSSYSGLSNKILLFLPASGLMLMILPMFLRKEHIILSASSTILGILYVGFPVSIFNLLVFHPYSDGFDYQVLLFLFIILWVNDTGAYISGNLFGRNKLFPRISPNKTWEGFAGGFVLALLSTWILRPLFADIPAWHLWILCPVIILAGTIGDLVESAWKRSAGVKDSGRLMPGHGGILDRFDSLLFAAPAAYIIITILT